MWTVVIIVVPYSGFLIECGREYLRTPTAEDYGFYNPLMECFYVPT